MSDPLVVLLEQPTDVDRKAILDTLMAYNEQAGGPSGFQPLAILINDPRTGARLGGLWGRISYDWLIVELFVVPEQFRGQNLGSRILTQAEDYARQRGCIGVWLDTYTFQAPDFYKKLGYEVFGTLEDHPRGLQRFFVKKHL
jgi:GNAT superfamily N-acetyltransferase